MTETDRTRGRIALAEDDELFRDTLAQNLSDEGFDVAAFPDGRELATYFENDGSADVIILDWRMPHLSGIDTLRRLRELRVEAPVIFLTALSDQIYEEAALERGAVDFVEKSRSFAILLRRIRLIIDGTKHVAGSRPDAPEDGDIERYGALELQTETCRAFWREERVNLTLTEFHMVAELVRNAGNDVTYRRLYDVVRGEGFVSGYGVEGYRANVRTFVKRIRQKFREVDESFANIQNYPGFGYRWVDASDGDA